MRRSIGRFGVAVAVLAAAAITACEPSPAPDGRELGLTVLSQPPAHMVPGQNATVQVKIENHGTASAGGVVVDIVADRLQPQPVDTQHLGGCTTNTAHVRCTMDMDLPAGSAWTVTLRVRATEIGSGKIVVATSSGGREPATDPHPNSQWLSTSVGTGGPVDLEAIGWIGGGGPMVVGLPMYSYTTVTNNLHYAYGVTVTQELPAGFTIHDAYLGHSDPDGSEAGICSITGQTVSCYTGDVPGHWISNWDPSVEWMMWVRATPTTPGSVSISHEASSDHPEPDPDPSPNTWTHAFTVVPA